MVETNLPDFFCAICTSAYIRNRCPTLLNKDKMQEKIWTGKVITVRHFRRIGCTVFGLNNEVGKSNFEPRSQGYVLVGYDEICKNGNVKFLENIYGINS